MSPNTFDDDFRPRVRTLGRPTDTPDCNENVVSTSPGERLPEPHVPYVEADPRPNDDGSGHTRQVPVDLRPLSPEELEAIGRQRLDEEWLAIEQEFTDRDTLWGMPRLISHPLVGVLLLGIASVLGLFLVNQVSSAVATLALAPATWQWVGGGFLVGLGACVLYAFLRLTVMYYRLKRNIPVRLRLLKELEERKNVRRWMVHAQWAKAWGRIENYLREYPLAPGKPPKQLVALSAAPEVFSELAKIREQLLDRNRFMGEDKALHQFQFEFQTRLDELAAARIRYWSNRTALATAISPNGLADMLATMYCSFSMLGDLCTIYHLRTNNTGTAILLVRIFLNAYLAGQLNDLESMTGESAAQLLASNLPISELLARVMGRLSAKVGTGMVNYFLLNRLGAYACRLLRPVETK